MICFWYLFGRGIELIDKLKLFDVIDWVFVNDKLYVIVYYREFKIFW